VSAVQDDRRSAGDRRHGQGAGDKGRRRKPQPKALRVAKLVGFYTFAAAVLVSTILVAVQNTRPIYTQKATLTERIVQRADSLSRARRDPTAPGVVVSDEEARLRFRDAKVEDDRKRFAADLVATGRMKQERADSIAFFAVREAYAKGLPPALILGVMLTENTVFVSKARSNVGAVGLMQIYPKYWLKPLRNKLGGDLENDETNLRYGAFILAEYLKPKKGQQQTSAGVRKGLLKYNGCVRGTNTPRCHTYPDKIEKYVRNDAKSICRGKGFEECIARPFIAGLTGDTTSLASAE
jgi:hypothetical protein